VDDIYFVAIVLPYVTW